MDGFTEEDARKIDEFEKTVNWLDELIPLDDDEEDFAPSNSAANSDVRREEIRRQRIESEQRRRDELRDGYRRLKDVLPVSNQKSSKVSLLDRGM